METNSGIQTASIQTKVPDNWAEYIDWVDLTIPMKWKDEAKVLQHSNSIFQCDLAQYMALLFEHLLVGSESETPSVCIDPKKFITEPSARLRFTDEGKWNFTLEEQAEIGRYANNLLKREAEKYFRHWMRKMEDEYFQRKGKYPNLRQEVATYA